MSALCSRLIPAAAGLALFAVALSAQTSPTAPAATTAFTGARIIDGTGAAPTDKMTIVVTGGRIQSVGRDGSVPIPAAAARIDLSGKTVMPGLINAHGHLDNGDESKPLYDRLIDQLRTYASYGVTTVVTLGDDGKESVRVRDENEKGGLVRAYLYPSGPAVVEKTADAARSAINAAADAKVDIIKTRMEGNRDDMTPEVYRALIEQAHKRGLRVAAHLYYLNDAQGLVNAGLDIMGHSVRDLDIDAAFVQEIKKRNVGYIPTLTRELSIFAYETTPAFFKDPFFLRSAAAYKSQIQTLSDPERQRRTRENPQTPTIKKALEVANRNLKRLSDAGVPIAMGTDSGASIGRFQGYFEHVELEMMVKAGMTPMQALVAATGGAAKVLQRNEAGLIQQGRRADLLVLNADPLSHIMNTRQIHSVWVAGRRLQ